MVGGNGKNQFRRYAGQNVGNLNGYNAVQNVRNQVVQNAVQNSRVQNIRNQNGLIGVPGNANQNLNGIEANDQAIPTILLGLPEDIYAPFDSCETTQKI
uniref:Reverse transcriptase domain-containing protein n=1 Tax=Tanacetum cinerariifolium TaxID=118510 RepID=A0A699S1V8_TANCI|nr:hypothetical protein [Tanacetum cinerariifolium]